MKIWVLVGMAGMLCGAAAFRMQAPEKPVPIQGVWIAAPQHNTILHSRENIREQIRILRQSGINTLFLCAWADNKTAFKSKVLLENSSYPTLEEGWMFKNYTDAGKNPDPVKELIRQAHRAGMKVVFWFEYGFMAQWGKEPRPDQHPILAARPHWASRGNDGKTANYNGSDYYFNAYHPEVQQFMLDLISESLELYPEVDGIQGDDRLPASPANSGYDSSTVARYRQYANGQLPPTDFRDSTWFGWRVKQLNDFADRMHALVKARQKRYIMAFSPNPYPWCLENLMQDWPAWVRNGRVDMLNVQCYRTNMRSYTATVSDAYATAAAAGLEKSRFSPGVILGIASKKMIEPATLDSMLQYNRTQGYGGQSYFYVKWIAQDTSLRAVMRKEKDAR
ncbi:MAG: glycoside hydrolase family 10 protein [Haliscomenobacter sp.]